MQKVLSLPRHLADRPGFQRFLEILPGTVTWLFLFLPFVLSFVAPIWVAYLVIGFDLFWLIRASRLSYFLIRGYSRLHREDQLNWRRRMNTLSNIDKSREEAGAKLVEFLQANPGVKRRLQWSRAGAQSRRQYRLLRRWHDELGYLATIQSAVLNPRELYQAVIMATYNEPRAVLESSIQGLLEADYPLERLMLVIAYEERGGAVTEATAKQMIKNYGHHFGYAVAVKHPKAIPGEVIGKGGNITYAGRQLAKYVAAQGIDPEKVIVTTLDCDHRPSRNYFAYLSYVYASDPNRQHRTYQPMAMFYNNIWEAAAPMRVIAVGNSFWMLMESMRPNRLRNFAAHAQGLRTLLDTDFWSVTTIVEDGHQYWRTYFTYDGDHQAVPLYTAIYQDAVQADNYWRSFKVQYVQIRRWAWGISDFPYVVINSLRNPRIPWASKSRQIARLFEGHFSWATASLVITLFAWLPLLLNRLEDEYLALQLPVITGNIMRVTAIGLTITILLSLRLLPPRPAGYSRWRMLGMVGQWLLLPFTAIVFGSVAALDAQTRLIFGKRLDFVVTEKVRKK